MRKTSRKIFCAILLAAALTSGASAAAISIIASVGNEAITTQDLINRTRFVIMTSGLKNDEETAQKIAPQVLQTMINEKLQLQEAQRLDLKIRDSETDNAIADIEQKNKMPPGGMRDFLGTAGIPYSIFQQQVKSQLAWAMIKTRTINPKVIISDDEVDDFIHAQSMNLTQTEYHIQEIVLPVENPEDEPKILETANKLISELNAGKDFATIAKQFSQSASAMNDGDVGWLAESNIPKELLAEIKVIREGQISKPVRSIEGYFILKLLGSRKVDSNADESLVTLREFSIPVKQGANVPALLAKAEKLPDPGRACMHSADYAKSNGLNLKDHGTLRIRETGRIADLVTRLETGKFSRPLNLDNGISVLLVCEKIEDLTPEIDDTKRDNARLILRNRKVELDARKYLRDLRRNTNIEIKS